MTWRSEPDAHYLERARAELAAGERRPYCTVRVFSGERSDFRGHRCGNRVPKDERTDLRCSRHQNADARRAAKAAEERAQREALDERRRLAAAQVGLLPPELEAKAEYLGMRTGYSLTRVSVDLGALRRLLGLNPAEREGER